MVSEKEPRYQSSKTALLQSLICHLPKAEYSFILPVKFSWVPFCLPRTAPECQGSVAHIKVTPKLEHSSEITHAFAQVSQGFWGNWHCRSMPAILNAGSASVWRQITTECEMYGGTFTNLPLVSENSLLVSRGLPQGTFSDTLLPGWLFWMTPSQVSFTVQGAWSSVKAKGWHLSMLEIEALNFHTPMSFNVYGLILTMSYLQIHKMGTILLP